jgi:hypothetical protein
MRYDSAATATKPLEHYESCINKIKVIGKGKAIPVTGHNGP